MRHLAVVAALLLASLIACAQPPTPLRILFVGNSLTYYNDAPRIAGVIVAAAQPGRAIQVEMLASGGASIADHLRAGQLAKLLDTHTFDVVVLQDLGGFPACPRSFPGCTQAVASVCDAAQRVRAAHARPILFGTWQQSSARFQRVLSDATRDEAKRCGVEVADVGAAMQRFVERNNGERVWRDDGHPTLTGSWIVAATLSQAILTHAIKVDLPIPGFCRKRWQEAHLSDAVLASKQRLPKADCERPSDHVLQAILSAADGAH